MRIFEPFFTTKPSGVGTGLGLPFCRGIAEEHGGTLKVESQPNQGAMFLLELPVEQAPATVLEPAVPQVVEPAEKKTVLIVDDESGITGALVYLLRRDGYQVETASNGRIALHKLQEQTYDLILSDLRMPELDGAGLYRELERHYPHLLRRVIFLTGDTLSPETRQLLEEVGVPHLTKPFTAADIRQVVQQALQI
jgi:two-component system NtrC family sensor kinase